MDHLLEVVHHFIKKYRALSLTLSTLQTGMQFGLDYALKRNRKVSNEHANRACIFDKKKGKM
jgi:hypothetical protein